MRKYVLDNEQHFETAVKRLVEFYKTRDKTLADPSVDEETRAYSLENLSGLMQSHREAIRDYLAFDSSKSSQSPTQNAPEPELARAA